MVHHTDSSGGRAGCHCHQRPGGWPGELVHFKIRLIFLSFNILLALAWIILVVRLVTGWTKRSTTGSVRCYWRAGQTLNHIASSPASCWHYERVMRCLCFRFQESKWRNIEVGDVVRLKKNDFIPVWWCFWIKLKSDCLNMSGLLWMETHQNCLLFTIKQRLLTHSP